MRRTLLVAAAAVAVVVAGCLGYAWQRTDPEEGAARNYLKALATGEGEAACPLMTEPFAREIATRYGVSSCPDGVDRMVGDLSDEQRERLGEASLTVAAGDTVEVGANPLGITILRVVKAGEEWLVTGDR